MEHIVEKNDMEELIEVCPGYSVTKEEYRRRFDGIDLEHFRQQMTPQLFEVFVKTVGIVEGCGLDPCSWELEDYIC